MRRLFDNKTLPDDIEFSYLNDVPVCNYGAPCPMVVSSEHNLVLAYYVDRPRPEFDGTNPKSMSIHTDDEPCAAIIFDWVRDFRFGPPDEEECFYYRKYIKDFRPGEAYVTNMATWVTSVGLSKTKIYKLSYPDDKHFIFTFHDTTVEVIAEGFRVDTDTCSVHSMIARKLRELGNG